MLSAIKSLFKTKHHGDKSVVADDLDKPTINEFLITEALRVNTIEKDDIDQLIKIASATKSAKTDLSYVKI